ncbi:TPA: DNA repair exonuclease [Candidatus Micrarchaeota archaeon]|nr:DNA repair exonuclease [Candidatus Micrarchaeota archaeon]HIH30945.1 DNA repair exonuclease [Candidatus Micrarchaeota archaeon]
MKAAFITDTHFGYRRFESDALSQGGEAILAAARESDLLILGGDNFDTPLPRMETLAEVTKILRQALEIFHTRGIIGVPIFAIHGNHDRRAKGYVHPTELLAQGGFVRNFHNQTIVYELNGEKVAVSGMGSVPEDLAREGLKSIACKPVQGAFNIFVLHQSFQEFDVSRNEQYISFDDLPEGYDLYLCGHVHKQNLSGKVKNPGSTVVTQLREDEIGQRGWLLIDTKAKIQEFRPIKSRELYHKVIEFEGATPDEFRQRIIAEVNSARASSASSLVKIVAKGSLAPGFHPSDFRLPEFGENVFLDNSIGSESLRERIAKIKLTREQKRGTKELAMQILRKKLEGTAYSLGDPEKVFESLLDGSFLKGARERIEKGAQQL